MDGSNGNIDLSLVSVEDMMEELSKRTKAIDFLVIWIEYQDHRRNIGITKTRYSSAHMALGLMDDLHDDILMNLRHPEVEEDDHVS